MPKQFPTWLSDRNDPRVIAALALKCGICKQPPSKDCRHPWQTSEPLGRIVHQARVPEEAITL